MNAGFKSFTDAAGMLNRRRIPYTIAMEEDIASIPAGETLVVPDQRYARASQHAALAAAAARGVRIVLLGEYGLYDENGIERDLGTPMIGLKDIPGVLREMPGDGAVALSCAEPGALEHTRIETTVNSKGDFVFHLFRIDNGRKLGPVTAELRDPRIKAGQTAQIRSFEPDVALGKCEISDGLASLEIYGLDTTASIVFR